MILFAFVGFNEPAVILIHIRSFLLSCDNDAVVDLIGELLDTGGGPFEGLDGVLEVFLVGLS